MKTIAAVMLGATLALLVSRPVSANAFETNMKNNCYSAAKKLQDIYGFDGKGVDMAYRLCSRAYTQASADYPLHKALTVARGSYIGESAIKAGYSAYKIDAPLYK